MSSRYLESKIKDALVPPDIRLDMQVRLIQSDRRVHALLEEMATDLMRINPSAAQTAAEIMLRLRQRSGIDS